MAIILLCEECNDNLTIHGIDPTKSLETVARRYGWMHSPEGWICPRHVSKITRDYAAEFGSTQQSSESG